MSMPVVAETEVDLGDVIEDNVKLVLLSDLIFHRFSNANANLKSLVRNSHVLVNDA